MSSASSSEQTYVNAWLKTMRKLTDKPLILYSGEYYATAHKLDFSKFDGAWIAKYSTTKPSVPGVSVDLWQYSSKGRVAGISGNVDLNKVMNSSTVNSWFKGNSSHASTTTAYYTNTNNIAGVKTTKKVYQYSSVNFTKSARGAKVKAGTKFAVTGIAKNNKGAYRFQLSNGKYITANQSFVTTY